MGSSRLRALVVLPFMFARSNIPSSMKMDVCATGDLKDAASRLSPATSDQMFPVDVPKLIAY